MCSCVAQRGGRDSGEEKREGREGALKGEERKNGREERTRERDGGRF